MLRLFQRPTRRLTSFVQPRTPITRLSSLTKTTLQHYFVDTNVIIGYELDQYPGLSEFIEAKSHRFYYTETVFAELQRKNFDQTKHAPYLRYVNSGISSSWKLKAVQLLYDVWENRFAQSITDRKPGYLLTKRQKLQFQNELQIIMEAGAVCHQEGVLPEDEFRNPILLTNNMQLLKKFIAQPDREQVLEDAINLAGMEHLLPVVFLQDELERWEANQPDNMPNRPHH